MENYNLAPTVSIHCNTPGDSVRPLVHEPVIELTYPLLQLLLKGILGFPLS